MAYPQKKKIHDYVFRNLPNCFKYQQKITKNSKVKTFKKKKKIKELEDSMPINY